MTAPLSKTMVLYIDHRNQGIWYKNLAWMCILTSPVPHLLGDIGMYIYIYIYIYIHMYILFMHICVCVA